MSPLLIVKSWKEMLEYLIGTLINWKLLQMRSRMLWRVAIIPIYFLVILSLKVSSTCLVDRNQSLINPKLKCIIYVNLIQVGLITKWVRVLLLIEARTRLSVVFLYIRCKRGDIIEVINRNCFLIRPKVLLINTSSQRKMIPNFTQKNYLN